MEQKINKDIKILSVVFLLIFFGFNGVQQYVTTFFDSEGFTNVGFNSLIILYLFFALGNPLGSYIASKYGSKKSMIIATIFYSIFIASLISGSEILIYVTSGLIGLAATLLWTGQNTYLIRASDSNSYGKNSGFFSGLLQLGSGIGILTLGFLIPKLMYEKSFLIFALFPLIGLILLFLLKNYMPTPKKNIFTSIKKSLISKTTIRIALIPFSIQFIFGLVVGLIPLSIKNQLGVQYIGPLTSLFFIMPIILSYLVGKKSDRLGRQKMVFTTYIVGILGLIAMMLSQNSIILIIGILLLSIYLSIANPIMLALPGDISNEKNLEFVAALFWLMRNIGIIVAFVISKYLTGSIIYTIAIIILILSYILVWKLFSQPLTKIKEKISQEIN